MHEDSQGNDRNLGARLKALRQARGMPLRTLAASAGCSAGFISRIENGRAMPSLATLHRLVAALGTNIGDLFSRPDPDRRIWRRDVRPILQTKGPDGRRGIALERLVSVEEASLLQANIHIVPPGVESDGAIEHAGEELGYVLSGRLELRIGAEVHELMPGDAFLFSSSEPHSYRNPGEDETRVLWVNTPPTF